MERRLIKQFEQIVILDETTVPGSGAQLLHLVTGSRVLMTVAVLEMDPGAQLDVTMLDAISVDDQETAVGTISTSNVGVLKRVFSDLNRILAVRWTTQNGAVRFKVALTVYDNASTTRIDNAQIGVDLDHEADVMGHFDSVRIGDGTNLLDITPEGAIPVVPGISPLTEVVNEFNEISAVVSDTDTEITSYTVPVGKVCYLKWIEVSGDNVAEYWVTKNGTPIARKRTYFGGDLNETFKFEVEADMGLKFVAGDVIAVNVKHYRPDAGRFEARILASERV